MKPKFKLKEKVLIDGDDINWLGDYFFCEDGIECEIVYWFFNFCEQNVFVTYIVNYQHNETAQIGLVVEDNIIGTST